MEIPNIASEIRFYLAIFAVFLMILAGMIHYSSPPIEQKQTGTRTKILFLVGVVAIIIYIIHGIFARGFAVIRS